MTINYYINGVSFASLGVGVSKSKGIMDALKLKEPLKASWPDHHGEVVDLSEPRYESREIALECFISAATATAYILAVQAFIAAFQKSGLQRLMIDVNDGVVTRKPLLYEVFQGDDIQVVKEWNPTNMTGSFTILLREPEPVKRVYKFIATAGSMTVNFTITTIQPVNIYYGDGSNHLDVVTASGQKSHTYTTEGTYYVVITGVIEKITGVTTGATEVWNRL